jgi:hypothetical protein
MTPRQVICPVCNARPGHPCNAPTDTGRRNVRWYHYAREELAAETTQERSVDDPAVGS